MGEEGLRSEGGGGKAEHIGRHDREGSNDGKTSADYARGLRESGSVGEVEVLLVGFRMRNGFREWLVMGLKERGYHRKKAGRRAYRGQRPQGGMSRQQDVGKSAARERVHSEQREEEAGR